MSDNNSFAGGLADEVTEEVLRNAFLMFGELVDVQLPLDYETGKHRGFAFIEYELAEDAADAMDNMVSCPCPLYGVTFTLYGELILPFIW